MIRSTSAVVAPLLAVLLCAAPSRAQDRFAEPVVVVTGEAVVKAVPDRAWVTIGAESRARDPKVAQAENAKAMSAVQEKLLAAGVPKDAIRTVALDLRLEEDYVNGKRIPRGWVAINRIEVRLDDVSTVGSTVDAAVASGATSLDGIRFDLKERAALEREALKLAVADARARAEAAAAGAGQGIDRVLRIEEPGVQVAPPRPMMAMQRMEMASDAKMTPVEAGEIEIRAQVTLTASLKF